ncbi:alanine racemase [Cohnella nanjingensis]|uniref:Alanine racemase n=1 Tax=Cohnella nanjingensis TaxID=1387779 RepID=A0A7X0VI03_9BACL|nr:alanine racemase [Cohnella nanjingensis]MBB6674018.1 alanine racemase [Cohnella nanjingensis]
MNSYYRPTVAEISLDAMTRNIRAFRDRLDAGTKLLASVKANAYGHGAVWTSRCAAEAGADYLGVAFLDEALQIRQAGETTPILVLGYVPPEGLAVARARGVTIALYRDDQLDAIEKLPERGPKLKAHVKIDSGMGRLGLLPGPAAERFLERACKLPQLEVEGMFTHYARADEADKGYSMMQAERFATMVDYVARHGLPPTIVHAGNSAAGIDLPAHIGGMLRLGISMYGLYPSGEVRRDEVVLEPVMSLKTQVVHAKTLAAGEGISYGTRYFTERQESIGTLPIGYGDGYSRMLSGKAEVLVRGRRVPVLGTICMDQCMIRLDDAVREGESPVAPGEEVVLFGRQGDAVLPVEELAAKLGTINYEVTCMMAARIPRLYVKDGVVISAVNPLIG